MSKYITVSEYAQQEGVTERTAYRWVKNNDIDSKRIKGVLHVKIDKEGNDKDEFILTLKSENSHLREQIEYLQQRLEQAQDQVQEDRQRADTIIMQLTKQLEQQTLMLEDMRDRSLWTRLKAAFSFASE